MLDSIFDLEADLGVDTVKQAEMFAAIRATYNIPRDENGGSETIPTLAHVIRFVFEKRPDLAASAAIAAANILPSTNINVDEERETYVDFGTSRGCSARQRGRVRRRTFLALVVEKTGYPKTCWIWISTSKPISASILLSRRKCSPPFAQTYNIPARRKSQAARLSHSGPCDPVRI